MFQANNIQVYPKVFKPIKYAPSKQFQVYPKVFKPIKYVSNKQYSRLSKGIKPIKDIPSKQTIFASITRYLNLLKQTVLEFCVF